jgi:hypothetical protein
MPGGKIVKYYGGEMRINDGMHQTRSRGLAKPSLVVWGIILISAIVLSGCKKDPKVVFIQGEWYRKNAHLANIPGEPAQETSWYFDNGYFSVGSCCFVKSYFSGYYVVTERGENSLTLELTNLEGQNGDMILHRDDKLYADIQIDTKADTLMINSEGPFSRVSP